MSNHDQYCPSNRYPRWWQVQVAASVCCCGPLRRARDQEREQIARAILAERDARPVGNTDSPWRAMTAAARIARGSS